MTDAPELHELAGGDFIWHAFDRSVKADFYSTGLATRSGTYLIDPILLGEDILTGALAGGKLAGVFVTSANHARAAALIAENTCVPLYAHRESALATEHIPIGEPGGAELRGIEFISIFGAAPGEIAIHRADDRGGTLVIGDAIINAGSYGFTLLPAKYCADQKLLKKSLRKLLAYDFERIFFAHGAPILAHGHKHFAALLDEPT